VGTFVVAAVAGMIGTAKTAQCIKLLNSAGQEMIRYLKSLRP
jgi:hypothetical protein